MVEENENKNIKSTTLEDPKITKKKVKKETEKENGDKKEAIMISFRKTAIIVGILYIIGTVAGVLTLTANSLIEDADYLNKLSANENQVIIGAILILIMGIALSMMSVVLYPVLKKHNKVLALGAVVFRGALEAVAYIGLVICWLLLLGLSKEYVLATSPDASYQILGSFLHDAIKHIDHMLSIVFSLGALMIYYVFFQSKLIPQWLSIWGIVGGVLSLIWPLLSMFNHDYGMLVAPLAVQEMVMAAWLIVKGFDPSAIEAGCQVNGVSGE